MQVCQSSKKKLAIDFIFGHDFVAMAESKSVTIVPLNGSNYPTWKVQCRMALMNDSLWGIVKATETPPEEDDVNKYI